MGDYIKRDDVVKLVATILAAEAQIQGYDVDVSDCLSEAAAWVRDYCPEIDIVRCKECKHYEVFPTWSACTYWSGDPYEQASVNDDDFCSYGVKKGADDE